MLNIQKYLQEHGIEKTKEDFSLNISDYDNFFILNYDQINSPKFAKEVQECRALILTKKDYKILARSFDRFYNLNEDPNTENFKIEKAIIDEKVDGSLLNIWFNPFDEKWYASTRKMAFAEGGTFSGNTFNNLIEKYAIKTSINEFALKNNFNKDYTYIFEFVSPETRVVKPYSEFRLYFLAKRNINDGSYDYELPVLEDVLFPKKYSFDNLENCLEGIRELDAMDEGYVARIGDWRIKIKNPAYLAIAHLANNGEMSLDRVSYLVWFNDHEEYLSYFPEHRYVFEPYIEARNFLDEFILKTWEENKHLQVKKDFALMVKDLPGSEILFNMYNRNISYIDALKNVKPTRYRTLLEGMIKKMDSTV